VHEGEQRTRVAVPNDATEYLTSADVEGREQRARPATTVLKLVADDAALTNMNGVTARQRLHRLLVDAYDDGVTGWAPVEAANPCDLLSKVGIRRMEPVADTVRAQATGSEDTTNGTSTHTFPAALVQSVRDRLVRPHVAKDHVIVSRPLARQRDDLAPRLQ
jgi:hypothetical protein